MWLGGAERAKSIDRFSMVAGVAAGVVAGVVAVAVMGTVVIVWAVAGVGVGIVSGVVARMGEWSMGRIRSYPVGLCMTPSVPALMIMLFRFIQARPRTIWVHRDGDTLACTV